MGEQHGHTTDAMVLSWELHGNTVGAPWKHHGNPMEVPWSGYVLMRVPFHGVASMGFPWDFRGTSMGFLREFRGTVLSMGIWDSHEDRGAFMVPHRPPLGFHGSFMVRPW